MNKFGSLQGRAYELGGLAGTVCALQSFKQSDICKQQMMCIISQLGMFNLPGIYSQFNKELDISCFDADTLKSASSILSSRLFQGYVQGCCETRQFVKSLPCKGQGPHILWIYANPTLDQTTGGEPELAKQELSRIADVHDSDFDKLRQKGTFPFSDILFIVRTYYNNAYCFHLICYELSTHNAPDMDNELNLADPDDVYESLRRGKNEMNSLIRTREFRIASENLGLEFSPDLRNYFYGLLTHDKIAKKLFQGGGYLFSLYDMIKDRMICRKPFDKWITGQGNIEFHVAAFTDRGRHFLHIRENEQKILQEMGIIYKGVKTGTYRTHKEKQKLRDKEILATHDAILQNIRKNTSGDLRASLKNLYDRTKHMFAEQKALPDYLEYGFAETIKDYCPTGTPPTPAQIQSWLPPDIAEKILKANLTSMQDAHADLVKYVWTKKRETLKVFETFKVCENSVSASDDTELYVLSGTPGIGKTTALRSILADYPHGYVLIYVSPRLQVNTELMAKFDPANDKNHLKGKDELICLTTNRSLINASEYYHGISALSCCAHGLPDDPKFLFLSPEEAEKLERQSLADAPHPETGMKARGYRRLSTDRAAEVTRQAVPGVMDTLMQAIHRVCAKYDYKRIIACISTQANRLLERETTTFSKYLIKIFGRRQNMASVEKFAKNIKEIIFFIDEVTGDRAGRQTAQEIIAFQKKVKTRFHEAGKICPLKFRTIIADASLVNASSVENYLNKTQSQPDQIVFSGDADRKGLSIEDAKIMALPARIINANVYPASHLVLKWRPVLDFWRKGQKKPATLSKAYSELETRLLQKLASELVERWRTHPEEQTIVIIQNKTSVDVLGKYIADHASANVQKVPDILCLDAHSSPELRREIVMPASEHEKKLKKRISGIFQKGDLYDILIMTSSGTRGISFPNVTKIICVIPTFSLESNFMEFLQGIYRGRGSGKSNQLNREIELVIQQVFVSYPENSESDAAEQTANLFATQMILRMSIFTRIFGACELFGKSVACIPISGSLVQGVVQTTTDHISAAIQALEYAHKRDPGNTDLRYITENIRDIFKNEQVILNHRMNHFKTLVSAEYRNRMLKQFIQDANKGLDVIAGGDYIPENCYTAGELILQSLDALGHGIREKNYHLIETHLKGTHKKLIAICSKLNGFVNDKHTAKAIWEPADTLLPILNVIAGNSEESDIESHISGSVLNRWLAVPISALHIEDFWRNQADSERFKTDMKTMLEEYFHACLCRPNYTLPLKGIYSDKELPWILVRGPEIIQRLNTQFQTRYFISSKSLALLNVMLLGKRELRIEN